MAKYTISDIDDYQNRLNEEQAKLLIRHCNKYNVKPKICAWYDDMEDFYQDWIYDNEIFKNKREALERFNNGKQDGEFKKFKDGEIVRLAN